MSPETDNSNGGQTNKQAEYVQQVEEIVVDPDEILKHFERNLRNKNSTYNERRFKLVGFKNDGVASVKVGVDPRDDGAYYPDQPHPVWVSPKRFVEGAIRREHDVQGQHEDIGLPDEAENKRILREHNDLEEGTEEFEREHEESMGTWEEMWEKAVRQDLKDEIEFVFGEPVPEMETIRHSVDVRYEGGE
jgi:hypothetical protein